ncbi:MAG: ChbG/HpnK family deacetylase [bacterium]|nr:ChbG/HpnK family deacetylase [bacterium]
MKKIIVINADDLGFSRGTNIGIEKAHREGILTSASMMATGPSFAEAVRLCKRNPGLGVGVHLSLTLGLSVLPKKRIPDLIDNDRYFYANSGLLLVKTLLMPRRMRKQIAAELDAQIQKIFKAGIKIDHLDSQYHVHCMPLIFSVVCELARKYKIPVVRNPKEPLWVMTAPMNMFKWFVLKSYAAINMLLGEKAKIMPKFYGILHTRAMTAETIEKIVMRDDSGIVEILAHPGVFDISGVNFDYDRQHIVFFLESENRVREMKELMKPSLKAYLKKHNIVVTTFGKAVQFL